MRSMPSSKLTSSSESAAQEAPVAPAGVSHESFRESSGAEGRFLRSQPVIRLLTRPPSCSLGFKLP